MLKPIGSIGALAIALLLVGCATRQPAPVIERIPVEPIPSAAPTTPVEPAPPPEPDWRPQTYVVKPGDTLYKIALDHGLDYRELAAWNFIENINFIRVGQVLRLTPLPGDTAVTTAPLKTGPAVDMKQDSAVELRPTDPASRVKTEPKAIKLPYSEQALAQLSQNIKTPVPPVVTPSAPPPPSKIEPPPAEPAKIIPDAEEDKIDWAWPTTGKVVAGFNENANLKGVDIGGKMGQPVVASAAGRVVYAGAGLRGYGKLIIIKHNKSYLSAYAHNKDIFVKEGQQVSKGQKIAEMGNTDTDQVKLHFEIRRLGKPVDPIKFLPPA